MASILDLDVLLTRIASLTRRLIDYRTFGILLLNQETQKLEMKIAVRYGDERDEAGEARRRPGRLGGAAQGAGAGGRRVERSELYESRADARSELVIPMLIKERCIGVFDLESSELDAFTKNHIELLTLLASQAAVAIENARLYERSVNEERIEKELRFAQRVQVALLPTELPERLQRLDVAGAVRTGARARRRSSRLSVAGAAQPGRRGWRRIRQRGAGGPLWCVCSRAGPIAHLPPPLHAGPIQRRRCAAVDEHHPPRASARGVLLHALLRAVRFQAAHASRCPTPACRTRFVGQRRRVAQIELPGVPLGSFPGVAYDEVNIPPRDRRCLCVLHRRHL